MASQADLPRFSFSCLLILEYWAQDERAAVRFNVASNRGEVFLLWQNWASRINLLLDRQSWSNLGHPRQAGTIFELQQENLNGF